MLFGSDRDTTKSSSGKGAMIFSCMSGRKYRETQADDTVISAKPLEGDAKSAVVSDDTYPSIILVATKGKKLYKFKLSAGGELEKTETDIMYSEESFWLKESDLKPTGFRLPLQKLY